MVPRFFITIEVTLQLGIDISLAEDIEEPFSISLRTSVLLCVSVVNLLCQRPIISASQTNQSFRMLSQLIRRHRALARFGMFRHAQFHQGNQAAEIFIPGAILDE